MSQNGLSSTTLQALQAHNGSLQLLPSNREDKSTLSILKWLNRIYTVIVNSCNPLAYMLKLLLPKERRCCTTAQTRALDTALGFVVSHCIFTESTQGFYPSSYKVWVTKAARATRLWSRFHLVPFFSRRTRRPFKCTGIVLYNVSCILIRVMMQNISHLKAAQ